MSDEERESLLIPTEKLFSNLPHIINIYEANITKIDEKYIPDTIARISDIEAVTSPKTEFILNSSTEGSTKQFKITVDDNGVISATEIIQE